MVRCVEVCGETQLTGYDGVSPTDRPAEVGGRQLPGLACHHANHQAQHQRLLTDKKILSSLLSRIGPFPDLDLLRLVTPVEVHVDNTLVPGYGGHYLSGEED